MGSCSVKPYTRTEASNTIMEENEKINGSSVVTTRLPAGVVQTIPGLQVGNPDS